MNEIPDSGRTIRIGISACLLGMKVRFDGGHKLDRYLTETLGDYFEWVSVCPEVEAGFGTPRETMRLVQAEDEVRLVTLKSGSDLTARMIDYARNRVEALQKEQLSGYILKSDSPSCGMERVRLYASSGMHTKKGRGLFAKALLELFPNLPVEEEGRLCDPALRQNWVERVFVYDRLQQLWATSWKISDLLAFHTAHKLTVLSHAPKFYETLGRLVGQAKGIAKADLRMRYENGLMQALKIIATRGRHTNVLQHMAGYFKKDLDKDSRNELQEQIDDYRNGMVPLIVPLTLIRHYVRRFEIGYLAGQVYLNPHPKELALLNHV
jgi:uncharacterized protein YbgA (DUF1722 family)/uncharacterized protein YbbK (DUF523 family)